MENDPDFWTDWNSWWKICHITEQQVMAGIMLERHDMPQFKGKYMCFLGILRGRCKVPCGISPQFLTELSKLMEILKNATWHWYRAHLRAHLRYAHMKYICNGVQANCDTFRVNSMNFYLVYISFTDIKWCIGAHCANLHWWAQKARQVAFTLCP